MSERKTFWLSFCDDERPEGERFLGVAIVDVTAEDAAAARELLRAKFPHAKPGAEWTAAASRKAWQTGCNPGGDMASMEVPTDAPEAILKAPRHRLMSRAECAQHGIVD